MPHPDASFWRSLPLIREVVARNFLPALIAPALWMSLVSALTGIERIGELGRWAVAPLSGVAAAALALFWVTVGRARGLSDARFVLLAVATSLLAAWLTGALAPRYAAWRPGLTGYAELYTVGLLAGIVVSVIYALRRRRALRVAAR